MRINVRLKKLLVLALLAGFSYLFYTHVYPPVAGRVQEMRDRLAEEQERLLELRRQAETVGDARERLAAARTRLDELAGRFPRNLDQPRLLEYLENAAVARGLTIDKIDHGEPEAVGAYRRNPVELTISGPFPAQVDFVLALQGMPWLFRYEGVTLRAVEPEPAGAADQPAEADYPAAADQPAEPEPAGAADQPAAAEPMPGQVEAVYRLSFYSGLPPS